MGLLGKLAQIAVDVVTIPANVAKDVVTLGGAITDEESSVVKKLKKIKDKAEEAYDSLDGD